MAQLYDHQTSQWIDAPEDGSAITQMLASGRYTFPSGIDIPVVTHDDGSLATVPSENASEAFQKGLVRWQTPEDREAYNQQQEKAIQQKNFGDSQILAAGAGTLRGFTGGLSDIAFKAAGVAPGIKAIKEENPITSIATEIGGTLANPLIGEAGQAIKGATEAATLAKLPGASKAAQIAAQYGSAGLGSAAEGAFYGLGSGISEAALGDPDDVAKNIMTGIGYGAGAGGVLGVGFKGLSDAVPLVKDVTKSLMTTTDDVIGKAARSVYKNTLVPALNWRGEQELAQETLGLINNPEGRKAAEILGTKAFDKASEEAKQTIKEIADESKDLSTGLKLYIKDAPKQAKETILNAVDEAGGDINKGLSDLKTQRIQDHGAFDSTILNMGSGEVGTQAVDDTRLLINKLRNTALKDDKGGLEVADTLSDIINARGPKPIIDAETGKAGIPTQSLSDEVAMLQRLRQSIPSNVETGLSDYSKGVRSALIDFRNNLDQNYMKGKFVADSSKPVDAIMGEAGSWVGGNPNEYVRTGLQHLDTQDKAYFDLSKFVGAKQSGMVKDKTLAGILSDPEKADKLDILLSNIKDYVPYIKGAQAKASDTAAQTQLFKDAAAKFNESKANDILHRASAQDMKEFLTAIKARPDIIERSDRLLQLQTAMAGSEHMSTLDKYVQVQRALGKPVSKLMSDAADVAPIMEKLNKIKDMAPGPGAYEKLKIPFALLGPKGLAAYKALDTVLSVGSNPWRSMKTLSTIERYANKGTNLVNRGVEKSTEALLNPEFQRATKITASKYKPESKQEKLETFNKVTAQIGTLANPNSAMDHVNTQYGNGLPGAMGVQASLIKHQMDVAQFLQSKIPPPKIPPSMFNNPTQAISDPEISKFNRYVTAANNPVSVLDSIQHGTISAEEIETVKTLYPQMFKQLQTSVLNDINKYGRQPSYQQRLSLSNILGPSVDPTLSPNFIASMQTNFHNEEQSQQGGRPQGSRNKIDLKSLDNMQTEATRIANK